MQGMSTDQHTTDHPSVTFHPGMSFVQTLCMYHHCRILPNLATKTNIYTNSFFQVFTSADSVNLEQNIYTFCVIVYTHNLLQNSLGEIQYIRITLSTEIKYFWSPFFKCLNIFTLVS